MSNGNENASYNNNSSGSNASHLAGKGIALVRSLSVDNATLLS